MKKIAILLTAVFLTVSSSIAANITAESDVQHYKDSDHKIDLQGNVKVKYDDINVMSPRAEVIINPAQNKVEKVNFLDNAYSYQINADKKHEVKAKILEVSTLNKVFKATGRTQSSVLQGTQPTVIVTADNQEYDNQTNIIKARGAVIIYYEDSQAFADYAQVDLDKNNEVKKLVLQGHAYVKQKNSTVKANKFVHYTNTKITTATGNVYSDINESDTQIKIWSDFQQVDQKSNIMTASGHAIIHYKDYVAQGPKASVYPDEKTNKLNKVVFVGRSKITQEGRSVEANRINLTLDPKDFEAEGNVKTFISNMSSGSAL